MIKPDMPIMAKAMDKADIRALRHSHKAAVLRAKEAGYDIAYVYAAHDASILWHFLSPAYNQRSDEYGGSFDNRLRLLREVLEDALDAAAGDMAIALRFAVHEVSGPKQITCDGEGRDVVEALAEVPDMWDVNISGWSRDSGTSRYDAEGFQEDFTRFVKKVTQKPVLGVGRFTSPDAMVGQIKRGVLDIIGSARASIADPFLPNKVREGRTDDIRECIGCNVCVSVEMAGVPVRCTQNPTLSEEWRRGWHPERVPSTASPAHVLIVGGGPAGLEAALTLARAGHEVTLADASDELGGRVARQARIRNLSAWGRVRDYRTYQLQQMGNVTLYTGSSLDTDTIAEFGANHVLIATGATWVCDGVGRTRSTPIPGFADAAVTPDDVLAGATLGDEIVIYDDDHDYMANALAADLAGKGHKVHLVTPMPTLAGWMAMTLEQPRVIAEMLEVGVTMHVNATASAFDSDTLTLHRTDTGQDIAPIKADTLLSVTLRSPNTAVSHALSTLGTAHRTIGDAEVPGTIQAAVYSGHRHAREVLNANAQVPFKRERAVLF